MAIIGNVFIFNVFIFSTNSSKANRESKQFRFTIVMTESYDCQTRVSVCVCVSEWVGASAWY